MRKTTLLLRAVLIGMVLSFAAQAQDKKEAKKPTPQQERMAACNKEAGTKKLKGDERQSFMSACLKATPQDRMTKCNHEASGKKLKGDPRKKFMSECLKS